MTIREVVWQIEFNDRIGIGLEVFQYLASSGISVLAMEANVVKGMVVKFQLDESIYEELLHELEGIQGVTRVTVEKRMPFEQREHELETILNLIDEGIVAIDLAGRIVQINEPAARLLHVTKFDALETQVQDLLGKDFPMIQALQTGRAYRHAEIRSKVGKHMLHCIVTGQPVMDEQGNVLGAVTTLKGFDEFKELIHSVGSLSHITTFRDIIYKSQTMKSIVDRANAAARSHATILLRGESGTGKEMFARAIHAASECSMGPFIAVNCAALPETLLESELFGYEEGAFTGAMRGGKKGLFEEADGGTLFLDEIGEISPTIQVRLLRALQEHAVRRIGGVHEIPVHVRVISATHQDLEELIVRNLFREDLYYRLNVIPIRIPPLREHPEDVYPLIQHLLGMLQDKLHRSPVRISKEITDILAGQPWPGNVRQLENILERLMTLVPADEITLNDLQTWLDENKETHKGPRAITNTKTPATGFHLSLDFPTLWPSLHEVSQAAERQLLCHVLRAYPSSRKAGNILGVSNTTVLNKMKVFHIVPLQCP
ncbi:PAS domain-containing protein [Alicyclobacillaceae bacterium I2511]|nr:PAS domain-containing protein [Alicyclobacillaceae bacterium I2511]